MILKYGFPFIIFSNLGCEPQRFSERAETFANFV